MRNNDNIGRVNRVTKSTTTEGVSSMKTALIISWIFVIQPIASMNLACAQSLESAPEGWTAESPRDEIRPNFSYESDGGPNAAGCFVMTATGQSENMGRWTRTVSVVGGRHFAFRVLRQANGIENPRRNTMVRITWQDDQGRVRWS